MLVFIKHANGASGRPRTDTFRAENAVLLTKLSYGCIGRRDGQRSRSLLLERQVLSQISYASKGNLKWCVLGGSNAREQVGSLSCYHYIKHALSEKTGAAWRNRNAVPGLATQYINHYANAALSFLGSLWQAVGNSNPYFPGENRRSYSD